MVKAADSKSAFVRSVGSNPAGVVVLLFCAASVYNKNIYSMCVLRFAPFKSNESIATVPFQKTHELLEEASGS